MNSRIDWAALPVGHVSPPWLFHALGLGLLLTGSVVGVLTVVVQVTS